MAAYGQNKTSINLSRSMQYHQKGKRNSVKSAKTFAT